MRAPVLTTLRTRVPLPIVVLFVASIARVGGSGQTDWVGSDMQAIMGAILYLALVPLFVIAMASGWLRGDIAGWAWALARPISRQRWLAAILLVDVATLVVCVGCALLVLGSLPSVWLGPWSGIERAIVYAIGIAGVYSAAAIGGARGATAIGASLYVVGLAAIALVATLVADVALEVMPFMLRPFGMAEHVYGLRSRYGYYFGDLGPTALAQLAALLSLGAAAIVITGRAAQHVPVPPRPRSWLAPLAAACFAGAIATPLAIIAVLTW